MPQAPEQLRWPRWIRQILQLLPIRSQFVLSGNIRDVFLVPIEGRHSLMNIVDCLYYALINRGLGLAVVYDKIDGLRAYPNTDRARGHLDRVFGEGWSSRNPQLALEQLRLRIRSLVGSTEVRGSFVIDYASRLVARPHDLSDAELNFFAGCAKLAEVAKPKVHDGVKGRSLFNPVLWLFEHEDDVPAWFTVSSEKIYCQRIPLPDFEDRLLAARLLASEFLDYSDAGPEQDDLLENFAEQTDGLSLQSLRSIFQIARDQEIALASIADALRCYQASIPNSPTSQRQLSSGTRARSICCPHEDCGQENKHDAERCIYCSRPIRVTSEHADRRAAARRARANLTWPWGTMMLMNSLQVGRSSDFSPLAPLLAEDLYVSRRHAEISIVDGSLYVLDLESKCGTYVNGRRIPPHEQTFVDDAATIRFGLVTTVIVQLENEMFTGRSTSLGTESFSGMSRDSH